MSLPIQYFGFGLSLPIFRIWFKQTYGIFTAGVAKRVKVMFSQVSVIHSVTERGGGRGWGQHQWSTTSPHPPTWDLVRMSAPPPPETWSECLPPPPPETWSECLHPTHLRLGQNVYPPPTWDLVRMSTPPTWDLVRMSTPPPTWDLVRMSTPHLRLGQNVPPHLRLGQNVYPPPHLRLGQNVYLVPPPPETWSECLPPPTWDLVRMSTPPHLRLGQNVYPPPPPPPETWSECLSPLPETTRMRPVRILLECISCCWRETNTQQLS